MVVVICSRGHFKLKAEKARQALKEERSNEKVVKQNCNATCSTLFDLSLRSSSRGPSQEKGRAGSFYGNYYHHHSAITISHSHHHFAIAAIRTFKTLSNKQ